MLPCADLLGPSPQVLPQWLSRLAALIRHPNLFDLVYQAGAFTIDMATFPFVTQGFWTEFDPLHARHHDAALSFRYL